MAPRYGPIATARPVSARGPSSVQVSAAVVAAPGRNAMVDGDAVSSTMPAGARSSRNGATTGTAAADSVSASRTRSVSVRVSSVSTRTHRVPDSCQYRLSRAAGFTVTVRRVAGRPRVCRALSRTGPDRSAGASNIGRRGPTVIVTSAPRTGSLAA